MRSTSRRHDSDAVHAAAAPSKASWLNVPSLMLPPPRTRLTL